MTARIPIALLACCAVLGLASGYAEEWEDLVFEADSLMAVGEYAPAESLYQLSASVAEEAYGADHPNLAISLNALGSLYTDLGDFATAESLLSRALNIRLDALGTGSPDVASNRYDLATLYLYGGRLDQAEEEIVTGLSAMTDLYGPDHLEVARYYHGLGGIYLSGGRYREAGDLLKHALAIKEAALGPTHPENIKTLVNLGVLYGNLGRYAEAEQVLAAALTIAESNFGTEHPIVASILLNLGNVSVWLGDYVKARLAFGRAMEIMEMFLGPYHPDIAGCLDNLASVAGRQGILAESCELHQRALAIRERSLGSDHPDVAMSLCNLGAALVDEGRYDEAKAVLERAFAIDTRTLGGNHSGVAADLENIAGLALEQGDYREADSLYTRALAIRQAAEDPQLHEIARTLGYLGRLRIQEQRFDEAETLCRKSLVMAEEIFGEDHFAVAENLERLSVIARALNRPLEATDLAERAVWIRHRALAENATVLSEADALTYSGSLRGSFDNYLSCYNSLAREEKAKTSNPADIVLSCKGQVSDGIFERNRSMVEEADSATATITEALRFSRFQLAGMFIEGPGEDLETYRQASDELEDEIADLESELAMRSASYRRHRQYRNVTAASIVELLPEGACLVEYLRYNHADPIAGTSMPRYMAVVAKSGTDPVIVSIGSAPEVDGLVNRYREHMLRVSRAAVPPTPIDLAEYKEIGEALWEMIWAPVSGYTTGHQMVFIAPDGALNMVAYAGLIGPDGDYLTGDLAIHYLTSARDMLRLGADVESGQGLLVFGDPDYDAVSPGQVTELAGEPGVAGGPVAGLTRRVRSGCEALSEVTVPPLPGTREEIRLIVDLWNMSTDEPATVYTRGDASESRLKAEAHDHRVIHLATHGYFLNKACARTVMGGESAQRPRVTGENPLLLSGLFLAGANARGGDDLSRAGEDGILTAYEVAMLDLDGTDLVVLSACETGLGEVREGEGVYGLRRAFQLAGARTVVSALWPIPDEATAEMAGLLYEREEAPIAERIRRAQKETIDALRSRGKPDHPYLWAGFIAVGAWQ
ncbi:MAG: CHAT domain-containing tetratricopeptide repeat protein [Candidatus Eisenbacteria bacterium]